MNPIFTFDDVFSPDDLGVVQQAGLARIRDLPKSDVFYREGKTFVFDSVEDKTAYDVLFSRLGDLLTTKIIPLFEVQTIFGVKHTGFEFHTYEPGDICRLHADGEISSDAIADSSNPLLTDIRIASVVLCLSDIADGGALVFPKQETVVPAKRGRVTVFPPYSFFPHYTTPATVRRDIVVTWFAYEKALAVNPGMFKGVYEK